MAIPPKPVGAYYAVILRLPDFSMGENALKGGIGGSAPFPLPKMGELCACCNAPARHAVSFDVGTSSISAPPVPVPTCSPCTLHLKKGTGAAQALGIGVAVVGFGVVHAVCDANWPLTVLCVAAALVLSIVFLVQRRKRVKAAAEGHHAHLEVSVRMRQSAVRTTNHALAERLVEAHGAEVFRVV